jgi:ribonuclease Z
MVTHCYNTCFAIEKEGQYFLVDGGGGNGILRILDENGIGVGEIRDLFLTHTHTDHFFGVIWVLRRIAEGMLGGSIAGSLRVWGHSDAVAAIQTVCTITLQKKMTDLFGSRILFTAVDDGDEAVVLGNAVRFFDIRSTKLRQFGFAMTLSDGQRLVCLGDEPCNPAVEPLAQNADWLLSEAFCRYEDREHFQPYEKHHATVRDAAQLAERLSVRHLVLWHSEEETLADRPALYAAEAKEWYHGALFVPRDNDTISLKGESPT